MSHICRRRQSQVDSQSHIAGNSGSASCHSGRINSCLLDCQTHSSGSAWAVSSVTSPLNMLTMHCEMRREASDPGPFLAKRHDAVNSFGLGRDRRTSLFPNLMLLIVCIDNREGTLYHFLQRSCARAGEPVASGNSWAKSLSIELAEYSASRA